MRDLHHPPLDLVPGIVGLLPLLLAPTSDMGNVPAQHNDRQRRLAGIRIIQAQMLRPLEYAGPLNLDQIQQSLKLGSRRAGWRRSPLSRAGRRGRQQEYAACSLFSPGRWDCFQATGWPGGLRHAAVRTQPAPVDALGFVVASQPRDPQVLEKNLLAPVPEIAVYRARRAEFLWQGLPQDAVAHDIEDGPEHLALAHRGAATPGLSLVRFFAIPLRLRYQRLCRLPELVGDFP